MDIDPQLKERLMLYGGLIPGAISLIVMMSVWYLHAFSQSRADHIDDGYEDEFEESERKPHSKSIGPRWALPMLLVVGFVGADYASNEIFHLWPQSNNYRYPHAIGLIMLAAIVEGLISLPILLGFATRLLAFGGAFWMLSEGYVDAVFGDSATFVGYTVVAAVAASLISTAADRNSEEMPGWIDSITWLVIAGGSMPILLANHFAIGAMIPAGIIAVLVSTLITSLIFRNLRLSRGGVTVLVGVMLTMLTGSIVQTGADNLPALLLLGVSPMVVAIPLKGVGGIKQLLIRLILLVVILGSSGGLMYWSSAKAGDDQAGYDESIPIDFEGAVDE